jgi:hypothetical protein
VTLEIDPVNLGAIFEHLQPPLPALTDATGPVVLEVRVIDVAPADSRDIIKAMAEAADSCGGQCGCGCGSHCARG